MFLGGSIIMFLLAVVKPGDDKSIFSVKIELLSLFGFDGVRTRCIGVASLESSALSGLPLPLRDPLTISPARILASENNKNRIVSNRIKFIKYRQFFLGR